MTSPIDTLYQEQRALVAFLEERRELSYLSTVTSLQQKSLLLAAASYFEHEIQRIMVAFVEHRASGDEALVSLLKKKAIDRQYHTYFKWDGNNANQFFSLFGSSVAEKCKDEVKASAPVKDSIVAFLYIGNKRNELVHLNFVSFSLDVTADEIYAHYQRAHPFLGWLKGMLSLPVAHETGTETPPPIERAPEQNATTAQTSSNDGGPHGPIEGQTAPSRPATVERDPEQNAESVRPLPSEGEPQAPSEAQTSSSSPDGGPGDGTPSLETPRVDREGGA